MDSGMQMTELLQVYKCEICGNIVMVLHAGAGRLTCCGKPMSLLEERTVDVGKEKHVPVVERTGEGVTIKVGSIPHPMEEKHYIEWIQVVKGDVIAMRFLKPGMAPEFTIKPETFVEVEKAREYCNIHGLWSNKK